MLLSFSPDDRQKEPFLMRLPRPKFQHPPEVCQAIIAEHRENAARTGEWLVACGWTLADAARAAVNWDLRTMAAAIANERAKRHARPASLSRGRPRQTQSGDRRGAQAAAPAQAQADDPDHANHARGSRNGHQ